MQTAAVPYVAFQLSSRDGGVGVTAFWQFIPIMLMSAVGGTIADRFDRRKLLMATQVSSAVMAGVLWWLVGSGRVTVVSLSAVVFIAGLFGGLNVPIWQAFVSELVPKDDLLNAVTLNSTQFNAARAIGTFSAGLVIAMWSPAAVFGINAASFVVVLVALTMIRERKPRQLVERSNVVKEFAEGVRYVGRTPALLTCCLAVALLSGVASPLFTFLSGSYGGEVFKISGWKLGLLWAGSGIGSLMIAPKLLRSGSSTPRSSQLRVAMGCYGLGTIMVGLAPHWVVGVMGMMVFGGSYLAIASALNTTIQLVAREDMRGKSVAIYIMSLTTALPFGLLVWGFAADRFGIQAVTVVAGIVMVLATIAFAVSGRFSTMTDVVLSVPA